MIKNRNQDISFNRSCCSTCNNAMVDGEIQCAIQYYQNNLWSLSSTHSEEEVATSLETARSENEAKKIAKSSLKSSSCNHHQEEEKRDDNNADARIGTDISDQSLKYNSDSHHLVTEISSSCCSSSTDHYSNHDDDDVYTSDVPSMLYEIMTAAEEEGCSTTTTELRLAPEVKEFRNMLHQFLTSYSQIQQTYHQFDSQRILEHYPIATTMEHNSIPLMQQQSLKGTPVTTMDELYEAAVQIQPPFQQFLQDTVKIANHYYNNSNSNSNLMINMVLVPLKSKEGALEKIQKKQGSISNLWDIVRASIVCHSVEHVTTVLDVLQQQHEQQTITIVKIKNRFQKPTLSGYRDFLVLVRVTACCGLFKFQHICEIQIHLQPLVKLGIQLESHKCHKFFSLFLSGTKEEATAITTTLSYSSFEEDETDEACIVEDENSFSSNNNVNDDRQLITGKEKSTLDNFGKMTNESHPSIETNESHPSIETSSSVHSSSNPLLEPDGAPYTNSIQIANSHTNQGHDYWKQGNLNKALDCFRKALQVHQTNNPHSADMATCYHNLATVLHRLGNLNKALNYHRKALKLRQNILGEDHADVAVSYNNVATVLLYQQNYAEALELYEKALEIQQQRHHEHYLGTTYYNLAILFERQGKLQTASDYFKKSAAMEEDNDSLDAKSGITRVRRRLLLRTQLQKL